MQKHNHNKHTVLDRKGKKQQKRTGSLSAKNKVEK